MEKKCFSTHRSNGQLQEHIELVHKGKNPIKCNECYASFSQKRHLKKQIESVHEGKKQYFNITKT